MSTWPKHPDGRPKKMGEMTDAEQREQFESACRRLKAEFEHPATKEKLAAVLRGENVAN